MTVACEILVRRSRNAAIAAALPASAAIAGLALTGARWMPILLEWVLLALAAIAIAALAVGTQRRAQRNDELRLLRVDSRGNARVVAVGAPADRGAAVAASAVATESESPFGSITKESDEPAVAAARWWRLPGLIFVQLPPLRGGQRLLLGRDALSAAHWRQLNVWLTWLERGRHVDRGV